MADLVRRREELAEWLEQAENAVHSLPVSATDHNFKELKVQQNVCFIQSHFPFIISFIFFRVMGHDTC